MRKPPDWQNLEKPSGLKRAWIRNRKKKHAKKLCKEGIHFKRVEPDNDSSSLQQTNSGEITAILCVYKRAGYFEQQVAALRAQTVPPKQIWVWCNENGEGSPDFSESVDRVVVSNHNWKFFGRFALANLVQTTYVALFDDDCLPQPMWFENCLRTIKDGHDGILGGRGIRLPISGEYEDYQKDAYSVYGWDGVQSSEDEIVDLVGHAWFARKAHFQYMWREDPYTWDNAEDIHLSYTALKYGKVRTYVPRHPPKDLRQWSNLPEFGIIAGKGGISANPDHFAVRNAAVRYCRGAGWVLCQEAKKI